MARGHHGDAIWRALAMNAGELARDSARAGVLAVWTLFVAVAMADRLLTPLNEDVGPESEKS